MKKIGIKANGERIEIVYESDTELEHLISRYGLVSFTEEEGMKSPENRMIKPGQVLKR